MLLLLVVALVLAPRRCDGCYIQGYDSGHCVDTAGPVVSEAIPFCAPYVNAYPSVCLPNEYDYFPNHTAKSKDAWVMQWVMENIARRQSIEEKNGNGFMLAPYEPPLGQISIRYFKNKACQTAYTRYMCYLNFPRCDSSGASLLMCRSACENFFKACNFPSPQVETGTSLWRCGPAKYLGGEGVEAMFAVTGDGLPVYQRAWWPGLPFADNEPGGCTPGVPGGAAASAPSAAALALAAAVALLALARAA